MDMETRSMTLREWLIRFIECAFEGVELHDGTTLYEAAFHASYVSDNHELSLAETAERTDWRRVPVDHLFARTDAIFFMNSAAKKFYSPAILRALLQEGIRDGLMYDAFLFDLSGLIRGSRENDIPFAKLYNAAQRAAFVRFCKFAAFNAPKEFGREQPLQILAQIRQLKH
jgi:hypothetical protein